MKPENTVLGGRVRARGRGSGTQFSSLPDTCQNYILLVYFVFLQLDNKFHKGEAIIYIYSLLHS